MYVVKLFFYIEQLELITVSDFTSFKLFYFSMTFMLDFRSCFAHTFNAYVLLCLYLVLLGATPADLLAVNIASRSPFPRHFLKFLSEIFENESI